MKKTVRTLDATMSGILLVGSMGSSLAGFLGPRAMHKIIDRNKKALRFYHVLFGLASAYRIARSLGPKTKEEQRLAKIARLYDKADCYGHRMRLYRRAAEVFLSRLSRKSTPT